MATMGGTVAAFFRAALAFQFATVSVMLIVAPAMKLRGGESQSCTVGVILHPLACVPRFRVRSGDSVVSHMSFHGLESLPCARHGS